MYSQLPDSHYKLPEDFNPREYSEQPELLEAWESRDLEKVVTFAHLAFDRNTDELVGVIFCLPDLYELWLKANPLDQEAIDVCVPSLRARSVRVKL